MRCLLPPMNYFPKSPHWLETAKTLRPKLLQQDISPLQAVEVEADVQAFAGWRTKPAGKVVDIEHKGWKRGDSFTLDFGNHHVGYLSFDLSVEGEMDAPVRLKFIFAELPLELAEPFDPYTGELARTWLQDEVLTWDLLPGNGEFLRVELPRRYAFRFVRVELVAMSGPSLRFRKFNCRSVTSANEGLVPEVKLPSPWKELDAISCRTLRNCMQEVFEDGPKRDRRLWMGDLRLQAMTNSVTFQNYSLVKRCLYFFAALTTEEGQVNGCVYEYPKPHGSGANPIDYALLFGPALLEYAQASGDWETAKELWEVALHQLHFGWRDVDDHGVWDGSKRKQWNFIDWNPVLSKEVCISGVLAFSIRQILALAKAIGRESEASEWEARLQKLIAGTRKAYWNEQRGITLCKGQASWLSQAWLILGGIISPEEGARALAVIMAEKEAVRPISPYGCHMVVEAMMFVKMEKEAAALIREFWAV